MALEQHHDGSREAVKAGFYGFRAKTQKEPQRAQKGDMGKNNLLILYLHLGRWAASMPNWGLPWPQFVTIRTFFIDKMQAASHTARIV